MDDVSVPQVVVGLLGGLVVFLLGLDALTKALRDQTGDGLRQVVARLTSNRFAGLATGAGTTLVVQSSSITTVLAVGLVSGGILTFTQSLGVVLGANIGTTATAQIIAFDTAFLGMLLLIIGYLLGLMRQPRRAAAGNVFVGIGLVFLGMVLMSNSVRPLRTYEPFLDAVATLSNPFLGLMVGAVFTAVVQSSTAATGVAIALAAEGLIPIEAGVAILIGANVGTCVTAMLAAIGKPPAAVRTAVFHVIVNLGGAIFWLLAISALIDMAVAWSPGYPELSGLERRAAETPRQFAMAHTIFNVSTAVVLVWFLGPIGRMLERLIPDRDEAELPGAPEHLDESLLMAPWPALEAAHIETGILVTDVRDVLERYLPQVLAPPNGEADALADAEEAINRRYRAIVRFLRDLQRVDLSPSAAERANTLIDIANELEGIANIIDRQMVAIQRDYPQVGATLQPRTRELLGRVNVATLNYYDAVAELITSDGDDAHEAFAAEAVAADTARRELRSVSAVVRQLLWEGEGAVRRYALVEDLLDQYAFMLDRLDRIVNAISEAERISADVRE